MSAPAEVRLLAKLFRGLADRSRLAILEALLRGPRNVTALVAATGAPQPSVSAHLACLYCCGLVARETRGRFAYYRIRSGGTRRLLRQAGRMLAEVGGHIDACGRYEERTAPRRARVRTAAAQA